MHRVVTLFAIVGWIGAAHSPAAAQNDAQTCARASSDDGAAACRRLLETTVTKDCQQIIAGRYPFVRGARADIPLNDFARLFAPNGVLDNFFKSYLAAHVDTSGQHWTWRQGSANLLSAAALQAFQSAAWIRQAFFQDGNGPAMTLTIAANPVPAGTTASFASGGTTILHGGPAAVMQWPGTRMLTMISAEVANRPPTTVGRDGPWSLLRVLEAGSLRTNGQTAFAQYLMAGEFLRYEITVTSGAPDSNPLDLASLRQFQCPTGN